MFRVRKHPRSLTRMSLKVYGRKEVAMADTLFVYPSFPPPEIVSPGQIVEGVMHIASSRRFDRDKDKNRNSRKTDFNKILEKEQEKRRWGTGDVFEGTDIGDPGFFFDYKM